MVGAPPCPECPVHIHLPLSAGSRLCHSGICIILPIRWQTLPKANCASNPLLFLFLLSWELSGCFDCLREARTIREGEDQIRGEEPLLTPAGSHPGQSATLPPQLITPGKPPPFPGDSDHFARPNGRHSLWVFKAQLLTAPGWRAARWEDPAGQRAIHLAEGRLRFGDAADWEEYYGALNAHANDERPF